MSEAKLPEVMRRIVRNHADKEACVPDRDAGVLLAEIAVAYLADNGLYLEPEKAVTEQLAYSSDEPPPDREQWMILDRTGFYFWCCDGHPDRFRARVTPIADAQGRPYKREKSK